MDRLALAFRSPPSTPSFFLKNFATDVGTVVSRSSFSQGGPFGFLHRSGIGKKIRAGLSPANRSHYLGFTAPIPP
ncbi:hypothetical protein SAMN03159448_04768 [Sinorhizobium sp. NFACC03]|nr:hypothetical protein SAMN03159448_04768 [Sinorhizobium sp. NFACC03]